MHFGNGRRHDDPLFPGQAPDRYRDGSPDARVPLPRHTRLPVDFRAFLHRHAELLRALTAWRIRLLVPRHLSGAIGQYRGGVAGRTRDAAAIVDARGVAVVFRGAPARYGAVRRSRKRDISAPQTRSRRPGFACSIGPGVSTATRRCTRRYRPSSQTRSRGARASWSAMSCLIRISISRRWSARREWPIEANGWANASSQDRSPVVSVDADAGQVFRRLDRAGPRSAKRLAAQHVALKCGRAAFCAARILPALSARERGGRRDVSDPTRVHDRAALPRPCGVAHVPSAVDLRRRSARRAGARLRDRSP